MGKFSARASIAMSAMVSIDSEVCSMSTRAKSRPAAFSRVRMDGVRTRVTQVPICTSALDLETAIRRGTMRERMAGSSLAAMGAFWDAAIGIKA